MCDLLLDFTVIGNQYIYFCFTSFLLAEYKDQDQCGIGEKGLGHRCLKVAVPVYWIFYEHLLFGLIL